MTSPTNTSDALSLVAAKLNSGGYHWMLVGSVAALLYGRGRTTNDLDIVLDCEGIDPGQLSMLFLPEYFVDEEMVVNSIVHGMMFNAIPVYGGMKVDLVPLPDEPFERQAFERRQVVDWHDTPVFATAPDDLVIAKLRWAKASGSERQLADVRAIMALELFDEHDEYFQRWISALGLEATLDASRTTRYDA
jgi:hypothetical protein